MAWKNKTLKRLKIPQRRRWKWAAQWYKCLLYFISARLVLECDDRGQRLRGARLHQTVYYTLGNKQEVRETLTLQPVCWATADRLCRPGCTAERHTASSSSSAPPRASASPARTPWHLRGVPQRGQPHQKGFKTVCCDKRFIIMFDYFLCLQNVRRKYNMTRHMSLCHISSYDVVQCYFFKGVVALKPWHKLPQSNVVVQEDLLPACCTHPTPLWCLPHTHIPGSPQTQYNILYCKPDISCRKTHITCFCFALC